MSEELLGRMILILRGYKKKIHIQNVLHLLVLFKNLQIKLVNMQDWVCVYVYVKETPGDW